jgi:glutathione S-transferase
MAPGEAEFVQLAEVLAADLTRLEPHIAGPWFNGEAFALVDAAFAPFFVRHRLMASWRALPGLDDLPRMQAWQDALVQRPAVVNSAVANFGERLRAHFHQHGGFAAAR